MVPIVLIVLMVIAALATRVLCAPKSNQNDEKVKDDKETGLRIAIFIILLVITSVAFAISMILMHQSSLEAGVEALYKIVQFTIAMTIIFIALLIGYFGIAVYVIKSSIKEIEDKARKPKKFLKNVAVSHIDDLNPIVSAVTVYEDPERADAYADAYAKRVHDHTDHTDYRDYRGTIARAINAQKKGEYDEAINKWYSISSDNHLARTMVSISCGYLRLFKAQKGSNWMATNYDKARTDFELAIKERCPEAYCYLGLASLLQAKLKLSDFELAIKERCPEAYCYLGLASLLQANFKLSDDSSKFLEKAIEHRGEAIKHIGEAIEHIGEAIERLGKAIELKEGYPEAHCYMGWVKLLQSGANI